MTGGNNTSFFLQNHEPRVACHIPDNTEYPSLALSGGVGEGGGLLLRVVMRDENPGHRTLLRRCCFLDLGRGTWDGTC